MIMKLDTEHFVLKVYKVYINDDPESTITHLKTMSNLARLVFVLIVGPDIRSSDIYIYKRCISKILIKQRTDRIAGSTYTLKPYQ